MKSIKAWSKGFMFLLWLCVVMGALLSSTSPGFAASGGDQTSPPWAPSWDKNLPPDSRFVVLSAFNNEAVRDNQTGLVWERAPVGNDIWFNALSICLTKNVGGTVGWRLPSVVELYSVRDPSLAAPFVPSSVFPSVGLSLYWSATSFLTNDPTSAFVVSFALVGRTSVFPLPKSFPAQVWCVRGETNETLY